MEIKKRKANKTGNELANIVTLESQVQRIDKIFETTLKEIILVVDSLRFSLSSLGHTREPAQLKHLTVAASDKCSAQQSIQYCTQNKVIHFITSCTTERRYNFFHFGPT